MSAPAAPPRWKVVSALGIFQIFSWGSSYYLPAPLSVAIAADTGWSPTWIAAGLSLGLLVSGLSSPRIGARIGQRGGREVMALGALLLAAGLICLGLASGIGMFLCGWVLMGLGMGAGLYDAAFSTLGRLYGANARPAITRLTLWGGFASTLCWPLSAWGVEAWGWRATCFAYAALHLVLSLPLLLRFLPRMPAAEAQAPRPRATALHPAERLPYGLIIAVQVLSGVMVTTLSVHLLTIVQARGLSLPEAVAIGALIGPAQVGARLLEAWLGGNRHPRHIFAVSVTLTTSGLLCLGLGLPMIGVSVVIYAAGNGLMSIARGALPLTLFGAERYGALMGRIARPSLIAQAAAPALAAWAMTGIGLDHTLAILMAVALVNLGLAATLWALTRQPPPPASAAPVAPPAAR